MTAPPLALISRAPRGTAGRTLGRAASRGPMSISEAGSRNRRDMDYAPINLGPNAASERYRDLAVARCRHLVDNNHLMSNVRRVIVNNVVADGIRFEPATDDEPLNRALRAEWERFTRGVDPDRSMTLAEHQRMFMAELVPTGECGVARSVIGPFAGFAAGPAVELIVSERLESSSLLGLSDRSRQGVEVNALGQRVAFNVLAEHPGDGGFRLAHRAVRVPRERMEWAVLAMRAGQLRGWPMIVGAVAKSREKDGFSEAFLLMAKLLASIGVYFTGVPVGRVVGGSASAFGDPETLVDAAGNAIFEAEPGLLGFLPRDGKVNVANPNIPPPNFREVVQGLALETCAGAGVEYAASTGDYKGTTFSATRSAQLEVRKGYRPLQRFVAEKHTVPVYREWARFALGMGLVPMTDKQRRDYAVSPERFLLSRYICPGWEWVDPTKEAQAAVIEVQLGISSVPDVAASKGRDALEVAERQADYEAKVRDIRAKRGLPNTPGQAGGALGDDGDNGNEDEETGEDRDELRRSREDDDSADLRAERAAQRNGLMNSQMNGQLNGEAHA